ncbi:MAG: hypothetical protein IIA14_03095 [SAR324 cluster bacterium]|nr:hypothetical protein [SAR324 cluster bacterium]
MNRSAVARGARGFIPKRLSGLVLGLGLGLLVALPALAAEEAAADHGFPWFDIAIKFLNFAILMGIILYYARKPVAGFFIGAAREIKRTLDGAREAAAQAAAERKAQQEKIENLQAELERMVAGARADAGKELEQLSAEAQAQGERIKAQTHLQVEQEMRKARVELRTQLADETVRLAEELIRRQMDETKQRDLVGDYIEQMGDGR